MLEKYQTFLHRSGTSLETSVDILIYSVQDKNCTYSNCHACVLNLDMSSDTCFSVLQFTLDGSCDNKEMFLRA